MPPLGAAGLVCHVFSTDSVNMGSFKWNRVVAGEEGPLHSCLFHGLVFAQVSSSPLTGDIYICNFIFIFFLFLKQEDTCWPFHSHSFSNGEVKAGQFPYSDTIHWANHLPGSLWGSDSVPLISLLSSYQLVTKSRKLRPWERYQMLTPAFVNYSFVCSEGGRDPGI